jgi:hypothetical protein
MRPALLLRLRWGGDVAQWCPHRDWWFALEAGLELADDPVEKVVHMEEQNVGTIRHARLLPAFIPTPHAQPTSSAARAWAPQGRPKLPG